MNWKFFSSLLLGILALSSCSIIKNNSDDTNDGNSGNGPNNSSYSYSYEYNGCKTGDQVFSSEKDYCDGLLDDTLNKGCARSVREDAYMSACEKYGSIESRRSPGPNPGPEPNPNSKDNVVDNAADPSFADTLKKESVSLIFSTEATNRLAATVGGSSVNMMHLQEGKILRGKGDLDNIAGKSFCSLGASAFTAPSVAYEIEASMVRAFDLGRTTMLTISNLGSVALITCEKNDVKPITVEDLRSVFGSLITIDVK